MADANDSSDFYVYELRRPWNGKICYIGKGRGKRVKVHKQFSERHYNRHLAAIHAKAARLGMAVIERIVAANLTEEDAFFCEMALIARYGRKDLGKGPLANQTDGGEGQSGLVHSEASREKMSAAHRGEKHHMYGRTHGTDTRLKISAAHVGMKCSDDTRKKMSKSRMGEKNPNWGKAFSEETRRKLSEAHKGKKMSLENRQKLSDFNKRTGRKPPSWLGRKQSAETIEKKRAAALRRYQYWGA